MSEQPPRVPQWGGVTVILDPFKWARMVLGTYAGMSQAEVGNEPSRALRLARQATHPDQGGDRAEWDLVEHAARLLKLVP